MAAIDSMLKRASTDFWQRERSLVWQFQTEKSTVRPTGFTNTTPSEDLSCEKGQITNGPDGLRVRPDPRPGYFREKRERTHAVNRSEYPGATYHQKNGSPVCHWIVRLCSAPGIMIGV